ncbi:MULTISPECIES: TrkH family potassium uptake protein [Thioclava]|uniref:Potassium transporter TrkH n=1 Tax=Thioclava nitratireducens TaxID=1915078 RepID=A0ABM6IHT1_9RHOB|nr:MULTISPECIES: potassium transporter TrkG [Thioclava]AQS48264.1 potassium transporter TrkH [Thioclava nitratireducens]OWY06612.1 potassium transporter TrkH [Thioclava sp. IC9]OWY09124.1 potassium transporter TrkH [Thioclava sp. F42-5]OWY15379.1 potassium transporter TrkH [Thioclava sp. F34-6]OWY18474.1 potassium transporter TrkH [Thioclava sp. JM3]
MERMIKALPLPILLMGVSALAMYVPAIHALLTHHHHTARSFFYSATLFLFATALIGLANGSNPRPARAGRASLLIMLAAFTVLPVMLAVPFYIAVRDTSFFNSWWEMVSAFTTTGGTLYEPDRLVGSVHLWRGLVAWMGGFFILVMAIAVLAPMRLGGFEVFFSGGPSGAPAAAAPAADGGAEMSERIAHYAVSLAPIYTGLTVLLWVCLLMAGDRSLTALIHAMSTLSTSGISPVGGMANARSGVAGEMVIFVFFLPALSRRLWPGGGELRASPKLIDDPELRLAAGLVILVPLFLFLRHWIAALEVRTPGDFGAIFRSIWGSLFTSLSFLTTTGFESNGWHDARDWSGLGTPGLILAGLAIIGGGVATTAGGVRLLRVYALLRHGERELDKLIYPNSIAGGGMMARRLRREGAYISWIVFMLFAISIAGVMMAASLFGLSFEPATILTIAALSNTGPLAGIAADVPLSWAHLSEPIKAVFAFAMVLGRLETLAIIALFNPEFWRA